MYEKALKELRDARNTNIVANRGRLDLSIAENRSLTAEEQTAFDATQAAIDKQDARIEAMERLNLPEADSTDLSAENRSTNGRPPVEKRSGKGETRRHASPEYRDAYGQFLATGERRDVIMSVQGSGGYLLAPVQTSDDIIKLTDNLTFIRALAKQYKVDKAQALGVRRLISRVSDADWTPEVGPVTADNQLGFDRRDLHPTQLTKLVLVSDRMLASGVEIEPIVNEELAYKFAVTEENAFLNGNGNNQPVGAFTPSPNGISTARDVTSTALKPGTFVADDLISARYSIKQTYLTKVADVGWVFNRLIVAQIRMLKDNYGQYLWRPGIAADKPDTILDLPFYMSEYAPGVLASGAYYGILGNWKYYAIADVKDIRMQRLVERYADTNEVGYKCQKFVDGQPVLEEAFARLKAA